MEAASWRCLSLCRQLAQTGEKTAQTSDIVIMMKNQPIVVSTTPNEPNAFPFAFTVAGKKKGVAALAPPRTIVASSAPGRRARSPIAAVKQEARHPEPEDRRPQKPDGQEDERAGIAELSAGDDDERDGAGEDEEEDREQRLVGCRPDLDLPRRGRRRPGRSGRFRFPR